MILQSYVLTLCTNREYTSSRWMSSSGGVPNDSYPPGGRPQVLSSCRPVYVRFTSTCPTPGRDCRAAAMSLSDASNAMGEVTYPSRDKWKYPDSTEDAVVRTSITEGSWPSCTVYASPYGLFPLRPAALTSRAGTLPMVMGNEMVHVYVPTTSPSVRITESGAYVLLSASKAAAMCSALTLKGRDGEYLKSLGSASL